MKQMGASQPKRSDRDVTNEKEKQLVPEVFKNLRTDLTEVW